MTTKVYLFEESMLNKMQNRLWIVRRAMNDLRVAMSHINHQMIDMEAMVTDIETEFKLYTQSTMSKKMGGVHDKKKEANAGT